MTLSEEQVEWIVAEVLRRLGITSGQVAPSNLAELKCTEQVVTMRAIEGRLEGVRRLVVKTRAVVTPAVKDELKQRQIELVREGEK